VQRVIFVLCPDVEILDLAGPVQVFHEANRCGGDYRVLACATRPKLRLCDLKGRENCACEVPRNSRGAIPKYF
jgi:transcriptional regulator GlxA family with amidase domain